MRSEFGQRLYTARTHAKLTQHQLSKAAGISQSTLAGLEREGQGSAHSAGLANACGVSVDWLVYGRGEMLPTSGSVDEPNGFHKDAGVQTNFAGDNVRLADLKKAIPMISWVQAGIWTEIQDNFLPGEAESWISPLHSKPNGHAFALVIDGDSMTSPYPGGRSFPEGTVLIVDPDMGYGPGDFVIAKDVLTQKATFKQLTTDGGRWYLKPINPSYATMEIDDPSIRVIGRVCEFQLPGGKL